MKVQKFLVDYDYAAKPKTKVLRGKGILADNIFWYQPMIEFLDYSGWNNNDYDHDHLTDEDTLTPRIKDMSLTVTSSLLDFNNQEIYLSKTEDLDFYAFNDTLAVPVVRHGKHFYGGVLIKFPHLPQGDYILVAQEEWMINGKYFNRANNFTIKIFKGAKSSIHNIYKAINLISNKYNAGSSVTRDVYYHFPFGKQSFSIDAINIPKLYFDVTSNYAFQKFNGSDEDIFSKMGLNSIERLKSIKYKDRFNDKWGILRECLAAKLNVGTRLKFRTETDPSTNLFTLPINYNEPSKLVKLGKKKDASDFINHFVPVNLPL